VIATSLYCLAVNVATAATSPASMSATTAPSPLEPGWYFWSKVASDWLTVIGTIGVCALAIWGEKLTAKLFGPRLKIVSKDLDDDGGPAPHGGQNLYRHYHLVVQNSGWRPALNCRINLKKVEIHNVDDKWDDQFLTTQGPFGWSFEGGLQLYRTVVTNAEFDFGILGPVDRAGLRLVVTGGTNPATPDTFGFQPIAKLPQSFDRLLIPERKARYHLEVVADNFRPVSHQVFEVVLGSDFTTRTRGVSIRDVTGI
jgi:hypothetical protein